MEELTVAIKNIVEKQVVLGSKTQSDSERMFAALNILLNVESQKYTFNQPIFNDSFLGFGLQPDFVSQLSNINEKQSGRKEEGRFYTPKDVVEYIVGNSFVNACDKNAAKVSDYDTCLEELKRSEHLDNLLFHYSVYDPTCGAGEFLVSAFETKAKLYRLSGKSNPNDYLKILHTIYGNDINHHSVEISKIRLFFLYCRECGTFAHLNTAARIINDNFTARDFVSFNVNLFQGQTNERKFKIIVGNPPYVEDSKSAATAYTKYGNIYANVLENSAKLLTDNGVLGFIVPLSYSSTERMKKIRSLLHYYCRKQFVMSYADRPDCLFTGVHQKLNIIICSANTDKTETYTSNYNYWYKYERTNLFQKLDLTLNPFSNLSYIPKLGNILETSIFSKIFANMCDKTISSLECKKENDSLYLNMRGCFWVKAFSYPQKSSEYKQFFFNKQLKNYILGILNSSLFFFFWVAVSDCWHITNKELSSFKIVLNNVDFQTFDKLVENLENKLETTKEYVGTKQTEYVYKHKYCKSEIDAIDEQLATIYGLTNEETEYIKNYCLKYRMSDK